MHVLRTIALSALTFFACGCATEAAFTGTGVPTAEFSGFRSVYFEVQTAQRDTPLLAQRFARALATALPLVALSPSPDQADLIVSYTESDDVICPECDIPAPSHAQDWGWVAVLSRPSRTSGIGSPTPRTHFAFLSGSANKLLHDPIEQLVRGLVRLRASHPPPAA